MGTCAVRGSVLKGSFRKKRLYMSLSLLVLTGSVWYGLGCMASLMKADISDATCASLRMGCSLCVTILSGHLWMRSS